MEIGDSGLVSSRGCTTGMRLAIPVESKLQILRTEYDKPNGSPSISSVFRCKFPKERLTMSYGTSGGQTGGGIP